MTSRREEAVARFELGQKFDAEERYEEALIEFRAAAALGHGRAMNWIGYNFSHGLGVAKDAAEAHEWFKRSAATGEVRGLRNLALDLHDGLPEAGVEANHAEAMRLMRVAAESGYVDAMASLIRWLREDDPERFVWCTRAAELGNMFDLGECYADGNGVEKDETKAIEVYTRGAEAGDAACMRAIGALYGDGACGLQRDMTACLAWFERAAATGDAAARVALADLLVRTDVEFRDPVRAAQLYRDAGTTTALFRLGLCYAEGVGVEKSAEKAAECFHAPLVQEWQRCGKEY